MSVKYLTLGLLLCLLFTGCQTTRTTPGATLVGSDLPSTKPPPETIQSNPPVPLKMFNPIYPLELRKSGLSGTVRVEFIVNQRGKVVQAKAVEATHPAMAREAEAAILKAEFRPATRNGKAITVKLRIPVTFAVEEFSQAKFESGT